MLCRQKTSKNFDRKNRKMYETVHKRDMRRSPCISAVVALEAFIDLLGKYPKHRNRTGPFEAADLLDIAAAAIRASGSGVILKLPALLLLDLAAKL